MACLRRRREYNVLLKPLRVLTVEVGKNAKIPVRILRLESGEIMCSRPMKAGLVKSLAD